MYDQACVVQVAPPTPSEMAEAEQSFQLAVQRQRPAQRRRAPPTPAEQELEERGPRFLTLASPGGAAPLPVTVAADMVRPASDLLKPQESPLHDKTRIFSLRLSV